MWWRHASGAAGLRDSIADRELGCNGGPPLLQCRAYPRRVERNSADLDELVDRLRVGECEIWVVGPDSGTSLIRAELLPRLARGVAGLGPFAVRTIRPGELTVGELAGLDKAAELLEGRSRDSSLLMVIDQLEGLLVLAQRERDRFATAMETLRADPRCVLVFGIRTDQLAAVRETPLWRNARRQLSCIELPRRGDS